jgi:hypothetical protein
VDRDTVDALRAVEALRAGVPNGDVVRLLKPTQADIEQRFDEMLDATESGWETQKQPRGMMIEGDFGTGKSHWLEYLRHVAIERGFVCSSVVLSKETPLYDLAKLYRTCVETASAPGRVRPVLEEVALTYRADAAPHAKDLLLWIDANPGVDRRFAATFHIFERNTDPEVRQRILAEWTGYPMKVGELKAALGDVADASAYKIGRALKSQARQRFEFLSRFLRSAGYPGWVLLIDETEMVSRYSLRQRARSYAHLAALLGAAGEPGIPGLASVFTITKDYDGEVLRGRKNDLVTIPARLVGTTDEPHIRAAEAGMKAISGRSHRPLDLRPLGRENVGETCRKVREIYCRAYGWEAPEIESPREYMSSTSMREYLRSWITVWDLRRLYGYEASIVADEVAISYEEDADLQDEGAGETDEPQIVL